MRQLTATLRRREGIECVVLTPRKDAAELEPFDLEGTTVHPYYVPPLVEMDDRFAFLAQTFAGVRRVIAQTNPDLVHIHGYSELSLPAHVVARACGIARIMHVHGDVDPELPPGYRRHLATTENVFAVSESVRRSIEDVAGRELPITILPNGIDGLPAGYVESGPAQPPTILMVGRLERTKGFLDGLDAVARLGAQVPDAHVLIIGRGEDEARLVQRAKRLGLAERLRIVPHLPHEECLQQMAQASVVLVPATRTEGFSLVAAEAGLCGRPVVATRTGGLSETVVDGVTGTLVDPGDTASMARALADYLTDENLARRHGSAGRVRTARDFSMTAYATRIAGHIGLWLAPTTTRSGSALVRGRQLSTEASAFRVRAQDVSHERLDGEVIAIHLRTGRYYSMSGSAADVWSLVDAGLARQQWSRVLAEAFPGRDIDEASVDSFVAGCIDRGLVEPSADPMADEGWRLPSDYARSVWISPFLEEFDDMQDLILVDPVHDTSQLGWPYTPLDDD